MQETLRSTRNRSLAGAGWLTNFACAIKAAAQRMKKGDRLVGWCGLVPLLFLLGGLSTAHGQLQWETTQVELNAGQDDKFVDAVFPFTNPGPAEVKIQSVVSSCSCTVAKASREVIPAGEKGVINARFSVAETSGRIEKTILVTTEDAPQQPTTLHLIVHVPALLRVNPPFVSWDLGEAPTPKRVVVEAAPSAPIKSLTVVVPEEAALQKSVRTIVEGRKYEVTLTPQTTEKVSLNSFRIQCEYSKGPPRSIWAYGRVQAAPVAGSTADLRSPR